MFVSTHQKNGLSRYTHVYLNEEDISSFCYAANDKMGLALCYKKNENGKKYLDKSGKRPARELLNGQVVIEIDYKEIKQWQEKFQQKGQ